MSEAHRREIAVLLREERRFDPPPEFRGRAHVRDASPYERARADRDAYWAERAEELHWFREWDRVLEWDPPFAKWFVGGTLNAAYNCLDRHLGTWRANKAALIWEGEPGDRRVYTYQQLHRIAAFVSLKDGHEPSRTLEEELRTHVAKEIGAIAKPSDVIFTADLPKTRSGKIMRRLLRDIAEGRALGDTTTLADPAVVEMLKRKYEEEGAG